MTLPIGPVSSDRTKEAGPRGLAEAPATIGRHLVLGRLGAGGMGVVYAAYDPELDRRLAIKVIPARPRGGEDPATARARVLREAQAMARISHDHVLKVFDVGTVDGGVYIAMELVEGETLAAWLAREVRGWRAVVEVFVAAGEGLAAAHEAGLIHRDFKPDNVLLDRQRRARVADFGLARASGGPTLEGAGALDERSLAPLLRSDLTRDGALLGTPAYMSPEHFTGAALDARSDLYSFCVALFEAVYGERPFAGETVASLCLARIRGALIVPRRRGEAPMWLWRALQRGLASAPERRQADMRGLLGELRRGLGARGRHLRITGVVALLLGVGGLWWATAASGPRCASGGERLRDVWDEGRRAAVRAAFARAELPHAAAAGERTIASLDRYADAWTAMRREACEATHVRGEQSAERLDLRMRCLDEARAILGERALVLGGGDRGAIDAADLLIAGLRPLDECADVDALAAEVPLPGDPLERAQVSALRRRLAAIHAREGAGRIDDGLALIDAVLADAEALAYWPVIAEARRRHAALLRAASRFDEAEVAGRGAYEAAERAGDDALRAAIAVDMVYIAARVRKADAAAVWAGLADALISRRRDRTLAAELLRSRAAMRYFLGDYRPAIVDARAAVDALTAIHGTTHPEVVRALSNLGALLGVVGDDEAAIAALEDALTRCERAQGREHPEIANILQNLAAVEARVRRFDAAREHYDRALALRRALLGPDHANLLGLTCNLAALHVDRDRPVDAARELDACEGLALRHFGARSREMALVEEIRCSLLGRGPPADALPHCLQALELRREAVGVDHPETARAEREAARALARAGQCEEARALLGHARALTRDAEIDGDGDGDGDDEAAAALAACDSTLNRRAR